MLYIRTRKGVGNNYGIQKVGESPWEQVSLEDNPFMHGPCFLCLAAQSNVQDNIGVLREGMRMARIRTRGDDASGILVQDSDITFCTYDRKPKIKDNKYEKDGIELFFKSFIEPLIDSTSDIDTLCKLFRNINIMTYCLGLKDANKLFELIGEKLKKKGFSNENVEKIMQNITCISVATPRYIDGRVTGITVMDVADDEGGRISRRIIKKAKTEKGVFVDAGERLRMRASSRRRTRNTKDLLINGDGQHTIMLMKKGEIMASCVPIIVTKILENARANSQSEKHIPLDMGDIETSVNGTMQKIISGELMSSVVLKSIDSAVYSGTRRASETELRLTDLLDQVSDAVSEVNVTDIEALILELQEKLARFLRIVGKYVNPKEMEYILEGKNKDEIEEHPKSLLNVETDESISHVPYYEFGKVSKAKKNMPDISSIDERIKELLQSDSLNDDEKEIMKLIQAVIKTKVEEIDKHNSDAVRLEKISTQSSEMMDRLLEIIPGHVLLRILYEYDPLFHRQFSKGIPTLEDLDRIEREQSPDEDKDEIE